MKFNIESAKSDLQSDAPDIQRRGVKAVEALVELGNELALYAQATWYLHGSHGYEENMDKAKELLERSSKLLVPEAAYDLAVFLEKNGINKNRKRNVFSLYVVSAILGDKYSIMELVRCFYWGIGTYKNKPASDLLSKLMDE